MCKKKIKKKIQSLPVQVIPSEFSSKPSEQRHFGLAFVLTHMWWQPMVKHGSLNYTKIVYKHI